VAALDAGGTIDPATGRVYLSLVNRDRDEEMSVDLRGVAAKRALAFRLHADDPTSGNTPKDPERVTPVEVSIDPSKPFELPPHSLTVVVLDS
jgi:alpha-L-arabinofuranosidase